MRLDPDRVPGVMVLVTDDGDVDVDTETLTRAIAGLLPEIDVVVIIGETAPTDLEAMVATVRGGGVAVRGEASVDAVKEVHEGLVVSTLDRAGVVRVRLPLGASPGRLAAVLEALLDAPRAGSSPGGRVRVADLIAGWDPAAIVFVDTAAPVRPRGPVEG
jgi:hypothetical protein